MCEDGREGENTYKTGNEKGQKRVQSFVAFCAEDTNTSIWRASWTNDFLGYVPTVAPDWASESICIIVMMI
jgi:hypothetical protein